MKSHMLSRRELLAAGGATLAGLALLDTRFASAAPLQAGEEVLPWLDQMTENLEPQAIVNQLVWEEVDSWITPNDKFFGIAHYEWPQIDAEMWQLEVSAHGSLIFYGAF